jgi:hypothetical protein
MSLAPAPELPPEVLPEVPPEVPPPVCAHAPALSSIAASNTVIRFMKISFEQ